MIGVTLACDAPPEEQPVLRKPTKQVDSKIGKHFAIERKLSDAALDWYNQPIVPLTRPPPFKNIRPTRYRGDQ